MIGSQRHTKQRLQSPSRAWLLQFHAPLNAPEGELFRGLYQPASAKRHPTSLQWEQPQMGRACAQISLSWSPFPGLSDHFITVWGIETTNLICQIIDFQGTCNRCCYCVLLLNPKFGLTVMKHLVLLKAKIYTWVFFTLQTEGSGAGWNSGSRNLSQAGGSSLSCLPQAAMT